MALGTITLTYENEAGYSPMRLGEFTIQGDDNYGAGGTADFEKTLRDAFQTQRSREGSLSNLRLSHVIPNDALAFDVRYDRANDKLVVRALGAGTEVAGDQSAVVYSLATVWG